MDLISKALHIAKDPSQTRWICPVLLLADAALSALIVWKIPYTEIDWTTYMEQISLYLKGERDYANITGSTGPLVYPAGHVYVYGALFTMTEEGRNIAVAQVIFAAHYIATLAVVMLCYRQAKVPPYVYPLLILSKRLHSIFMLRMFNDGIAVFFLFVAIYCYQMRMWTVGSLAYSFGVGIKMTLLLALPAVGAVLWQGMGRGRALRQALAMFELQLALAVPFLAVNARSYLSRAFEFTRQFLFKWTVNWRFVGEETFLSATFSRALLVAHGAILASFLSTRWLQEPLPEALRQLINPPTAEKQRTISRRVTPGFIMTTILSAMVVGCLCARSLHYQFYAYIAWATPYLLWRSGMHPILIYLVWAAQEWAWNVYPSSNTSSLVVVSCLVVTAVSGWVGSGREIASESAKPSKSE